jgi:4-amino-4-deoxy-L-arabinose transferase-like glycosyltransferase
VFKADWMIQARIPLALALWVGLLLLLSSPEQSFLAQDEGYYAQQARFILEHQDWITVPWWQEPVYDRAIGVQWLIALTYSLFGLGEGAARLPGELACLAAVLLTWAIGSRTISPPVGFLGAAILAVTPIWMQASQLATQDIPLTCLELLGIWALLRSESPGPRRWLWGAIAGVTVGLGFMIKSFMVMLPLIALLPYLVMEHRRHRHLTNPGLYVGLGLGAILPLIWLGLSVQRYGLLPLQQMFGKLFALSEVSFHNTPFYYYLWNIPANGFPWGLFALGGFVIALRNHRFTYRWLWLGYPLVMLGLLTLFKTRTWYYALQLYPFIALLAAIALVELGRRYQAHGPWQRRWPQRLSWLLGILGLILLIAGMVFLLGPEQWIAADLRPYGWIGLGGGLGWLVPWLMMLADRGKSSWSVRSQPWLLGILLGPWLAIASVFLTGLWGNYNPDIKNALMAPPIAPILAEQEIYFVRADASPTGILLALYTPHLARNLSDWSELPVGSYSWGQVTTDHPLPKNAREIATVRDWQLIQQLPTEENI